MRAIVVGDVHGCLSELRALITRIAPVPEDRVFAVGDFLTKGPDGSGTVRFWMDHGFTSVLGNNDQRVIAVLEGTEASSETVEIAARDIERHPDLIEWIRTWPIAIRREDLVVVHGGLFPGPFDEEVIRRRKDDILRLRHMRRVNDEWIRVPSRDLRSSDLFWAEEWEGPETVVYGHTPEREVSRWPFAIGIDTGCVYGYELTAAILDDGRWTFASVPAEGVWYEA